MTGKEDYSQLELFSQTQESGQQAGARVSRSFLQYLGSYEKVIMLAVGFIVTGIIAYCVGVEKGKVLSLPRTNAQLDIAINKPAVAVNPVIKETRVKPVAPRTPINLSRRTPVPQAAVRRVALADQVAPIPAQRPAQAGGWTIQIASYETRSLADQERSALQKRGLSVLAFSKGKYTVLCVGTFSDKQTAQSVLTDLKRKYRDCYIRRL
ncbi:MAG TPA: SPOR domain-containing protein [Candidatus Omnitrophota bacterium]|nr:SPOR domain-containing protein [Candidatus Omnitrophota bacterium]HRZ14870.1 SPOR domain-containing protein [Candidatus Omnitrophota bacterium]